MDDLIRSDSVSALNHIEQKDDNKSREAYLYRKDISKAIIFFHSHQKPVFSDFTQSKSQIARNLEEYIYTYQLTDSLNIRYSMKFEFTNFVPRKVYNFTFTQTSPSETSSDTTSKLTKEDVDRLNEISRTIKK